MSINDCLLTNELKFALFNDKMKNQKEFTVELTNIFNVLFFKSFKNILNHQRFYQNLLEDVNITLIDQFTENIYENISFIEIFTKISDNFENIIKKYQDDFINFLKNKPKNYLKNFRKHCAKTGDYAIHNCHKNGKTGKFIYMIDENTKEINFVICENCNRVYPIENFTNFCEKCHKNYLSSLILMDEDDNIFEATIFPTHCPNFINEKIFCEKCNGILYINIKSNKLQCLNKKCNFISNTENYTSYCKICNQKFKTNIIIYNPIEKNNLIDIIKESITLKRIARPKNIPCCPDFNEKLENLLFYHKKDCKGILLFGEIFKKLVIICEKCHAINFYHNYKWICPNCGKGFRENLCDENEEKNIIKNKYLELDSKYRDKNRNKALLGDFLNKKKMYGVDIKDCNRSYQKVYETSKIFSIKHSNNKKNVLAIKKNKSKSKNVMENNLNGTNPEKHFICQKILGGFIKPKRLDKVLNSLEVSDDVSTTNNDIKTSILKVNRKINTKKLPKSEKAVSKINDNIMSNDPNIIEVKKRFKCLGDKEKSKTENKLPNQNENNNNNNKKIYLKFRAFNKVNNNAGNLTDNEITNNFNNNIINNINNDQPKKFDKKPNLLAGMNKSCKPLDKKLSRNRLGLNRNKDINTSVYFKYKKKLNYKDSISADNRKDPMINNKNDISPFIDNTRESTKKQENEEIKTSKKSNNIHNKSTINAKKFLLSCRENENINKLNKTNDSIITEKKDLKSIHVYKSNKNINAPKNIEYTVPKYARHKKMPLRLNTLYTTNNNDDNNINIDLSKTTNSFYKNDNNIIHTETKPSDISEMYNVKEDIPVENNNIKNDKEIYSELQRNLKRILSKGKLPQFNIDNYEICKKIGCGSGGEVFEVFNKQTKIYYALKKIKIKEITELDAIRKEFELVHSNSHDFILDIHGICVRCIDTNNFVVYILMDLALHDWEMEIIERQKSKKYYNEDELITILKQLNSALYFLQKERCIAHRDIKLENILVCKYDMYKLCDFGEAKRKTESKLRKSIKGTDIYMSPLLYNALMDKKDYVEHDQYKSDVFSLGFSLIIAAALDFNIIYDIRDTEGDEEKIRNIMGKNFNGRYSDKFIGLLLKVIKFDENDRPDFIGLNDILEKEF